MGHLGDLVTPPYKGISGEGEKGGKNDGPGHKAGQLSERETPRRCLGGKGAESSFRDTELEAPGRQPSGEEQKVGLRMCRTPLAEIYTNLGILAQSVTGAMRWMNLPREKVYNEREPEKPNTEFAGRVCWLEVKGGKDSSAAALEEWGLESAFLISSPVVLPAGRSPWRNTPICI